VTRFVASWFGSGLLLGRVRGSDVGSGTVGSAVALAMVWLLAPVGWWAQAVGAVVVVGLALWSIRPYAGEGDPGWVVVDEAAGMFVASIGLAGWPLALAFVVFRIADATKRLPGVAAAERLPGEWGILADDLVAGVYGLAAGWALHALLL
jgi:phosphatidylglycerophosphatase A